MNPKCSATIARANLVDAERMGRETMSLHQIIPEQAFSRAGGAPLVPDNAARLFRDAAENYPAWLEAGCTHPAGERGGTCLLRLLGEGPSATLGPQLPRFSRAESVGQHGAPAWTWAASAASASPLTSRFPLAAAMARGRSMSCRYGLCADATQ
jgi:hypothetical protein